ncbi:non-ribosomal peptide synthetase, partial [Ruminococcus flavefaciens]|uniref:non-ribosomal peptide synthetase n=1 Tax=Ruminococcus flavefaciens TaxID=1265 RepID=UPI0026F12C9F
MSINNIGTDCRFKTKLSYEEINECINSVIANSSILRLQITLTNDGVKQYTCEFREREFPYVQVDNIAEYQNWINDRLKECIFGYDSPLIKSYIVYVKDEEKWCVYSNIHHLISDAIGTYTVQKMLSAEVEKRCGKPYIEYSDYDYSGFVAKEKEYFHSKAFIRDKEYWTDALNEYEGSALPHSDDSDDLSSRRYEFNISKELGSRIKAYCAENEISIPCFFNSVFALYKSKTTASGSASIGLTLHNRGVHEKETVGMFVTMIPFLLEIDNNSTVNEYIRYVKSSEMKLLKHRRFTYGLMQENCAHKEGLIDLCVNFQTFSTVENKAMGYEMNWLGCGHSDTLSVTVSERNDSDIFMVEYDYPYMRYSDSFIHTMNESIIRMIEQVLDAPEQKVIDVEAATQTEKAVILGEFNATEAEYPKNKTIAELFEEQVIRTPDSIAVMTDDKCLTYSELNEKANALAYKLRDLGVGPDDFVAIISERSMEMICGIYGIVKAGGAYVPIDPMYPDERINFMLSDCQPKAILKYTAEHINIDSEIPVIDLGNEEVWKGVSENPERVNRPDDLIYCIYTSGTTGNPKGVMNRNQGLVNRIFWMDSRYPIDEKDVILQKTTFTFDVSVWEIFWWAIKGARAALLVKDGEKEPNKICDAILNHKVTTMHFVPSMLAMFEEYVMDTQGAALKLKSLRNVFASGEALKPVHVDNFYSITKSAGLSAKLANFYGPTEASIDVTYYDCTPEDNSIIPIGRPISNTQVYILNGLRLCGIGVAGELCIGGDGVARGYLNRPELNEEKFIQNPFGDGRMYRTGDLAKWLPDGNIAYLGRIDEQVKIRGLRIELGEIESRLREIEDIRDCAIIARADSTGDKAIYAYYTSDREKSVSEIRDRLSENVPGYMIPAYMMQIDRIPVTKNGKLDRRALPEIEARTERKYTAPKNDIHKLLCEAFADVLNIERVGITDNFYELGGDSIKAIRIISKLRNAGYDISVKEIMNRKTVEKIAPAMNRMDTSVSYDQGEVSGTIENTPIINKFFDYDLKKPEHFNQAMIFNMKGTENDVIRCAVGEIVKHHDMLRAVCRGREIRILPVNESRLFDFYEYDFSDKDDKKKAVEEECTRINGGFVFETGPLVKAAVFDLGDDKIMMMCIHHIAVDGVSWRIISEDLDTAVYQIKEEKNIKLPEKTMSFTDWSRQLNEYGKSSAIDRYFWKKNDESIAQGSIEYSCENGKTGSVYGELSEEITDSLLHCSMNICGAKIDEVLLAGLTRAVCRITGQKLLSVKLEGHGRESIHGNTAVDRTVGWFTNVYAAAFEDIDDSLNAIKNAKDTLRCIPDSGLGYGFVPHSCAPDICFNYLGDFSGSKMSYSGDYSYGMTVAKENVTDDKIIFDCQISDEKLMFNIRCQDRTIGIGFAEKLKDNFISCAAELAEFCKCNVCEEKTRSDYGLNDINENEFDTIIKSVGYKPEKIYRLTPLQEGMLFHRLEDKDSTSYVIQGVYNISHRIDATAFTAALDVLSERFEVLRTKFVYKGISAPKQIICKDNVPEFNIVDANENEISDLLKTDVKRGFDLENDPLIRVTLIKTGDEDGKLVITIDHIIIDGWGVSNISEHLFRYYFELIHGKSIDEIRNEIVAQKRSEKEFNDYIEWLDNQDKIKAEEYWRNLIDGYESKCRIIPAGIHEETDEQVRVIRREIPTDTTSALRAVSSQNECTINSAVEAALGIMLQKYSRSSDVLFGKVVSGRNAHMSGIENIVGLFINTVPVRIKTEQGCTVEKLMREQQKQNVDSTNYEYYSLADIQKLTPQGSDLIKILYVFENYSSGKKEEENIAEKEGIVFESSREQTNYDLTVSAFDTNDTLRLELMYDPRKYSEKEAELIIERLVYICDQIAASPLSRICDLDTVLNEEKKLIHEDFNNTAAAYPRDKTVAELFEEQVKKTPNNTALVFENNSLTYSELNAKANSLAHKLREIGVKPDDFVAIIADKSIEMICGIYGIIKAGGAYVPIDPTYPDDRIEFMLEDCKPKAILKLTTESITFKTLIPVIDLADSKVWTGASNDPEIVNKPTDGIYCIYTSGTTGKPKGVIVENRNVVKLVKNCDYTDLNEKTVVLQTGQLMFDASTFEMWGTSLNGGTLHLVEKETMLNAETFKKYMTENGVNTLFITTALFNQFIYEDNTIFNGLKHLMFGGEATSERHVEILRSQNTGVDFRNVYGPTETTTFAAHYIIDKKVDKTPIGKPISNTQMYILNENALCGIGVPGELCIAGDGVARGYLNRPELTAE